MKNTNPRVCEHAAHGICVTCNAPLQGLRLPLKGNRLLTGEEARALKGVVCP